MAGTRLRTAPQLWSDGWIGELGLEPTVAQYVEHLVEVFSEVRRVLRPDGTAWVHMEDGYAGGGIAHRDPGRWPKAGNVQYPRGKKSDRSLKSKDLTDTAWRLALALQKDGWYLRDDIVVAKGNPFPEAAKRDRPYRSHGYLFG